MGQRYEEKGIKEGADYGTQFLNAKTGEEVVEEPEAPPVPVTDLEEISSGRSAGQIIAFVVIGLVLLFGGVALAAIGGGGDDDPESFSAGSGEGVEIDGDFDSAETTTTTTSTTTTSTTSTTTTSTTSTTSTTTTTLPGATTIPGPTIPGQTTVPGTAPITSPRPTAPPVTQPPAPTTTVKPCPSQGTGLAVTSTGVTAAVIGGEGSDKTWSVDVSGKVSNGTEATIVANFSFVVTGTVGGNPSEDEFEPTESGGNIAAGATKDWNLVVEIVSSTQPGLFLNPASYTYADPNLSHCFA